MRYVRHCQHSKYSLIFLCFPFLPSLSVRSLLPPRNVPILSFVCGLVIRALRILFLLHVTYSFLFESGATRMEEEDDTLPASLQPFVAEEGLTKTRSHHPILHACFFSPLHNRPALSIDYRIPA